MAIVWPCSLSVDEYLAAGRNLKVPRPNCPTCELAMVFWSGYTRVLRVAGRDQRLWVRRARCRGCESTHDLLPETDNHTPAGAAQVNLNILRLVRHRWLEASRGVRDRRFGAVNAETGAVRRRRRGAIMCAGAA